jgi:chemotaxis signal transduction protein
MAPTLRTAWNAGRRRCAVRPVAGIQVRITTQEQRGATAQVVETMEQLPDASRQPRGDGRHRLGGTPVTGLTALLVPVGPDLYAVPMDAVREVVRAPPVTDLPTAPALILGLFNLRGEIVPLLDTPALLGLGRIPEWSFVAVVRSSLGPAGLAATALPESVALGVSVGSSESPATAGTYAVGRRLAVLLHIEQLLAGARVGT